MRRVDKDQSRRYRQRTGGVIWQKIKSPNASAPAPEKSLTQNAGRGFSRKPRGVTDAQALAAEKKITKHIPNAKSIGDVLVGIAQTQEWIENVEHTLALRIEQDTSRKRTESDDRQKYNELRIAEASRKHTSTTSKQGITDAQANAHLKIL